MSIDKSLENITPSQKEKKDPFSSWHPFCGACHSTHPIIFETSLGALRSLALISHLSFCHFIVPVFEVAYN